MYNYNQMVDALKGTGVGGPNILTTFVWADNRQILVLSCQDEEVPVFQYKSSSGDRDWQIVWNPQNPVPEMVLRVFADFPAAKERFKP